jgi:GNAT superfamily N-acetyltransferase
VVGSEPAFRFYIEPLGKQHERATFSCGNDALDRYFRSQAFQDVRKRVAAAFILVSKEDDKTVGGFYTLSATVIRLVDLPEKTAKKLPKYPNMPATLLGRLAVDKRYRGQGLGEFLLLDALQRSLSQSRGIGSVAVVVDAKNEQTRYFYRRYEFIQFPDYPSRLFLPMKSIEMLFAASSDNER